MDNTSRAGQGQLPTLNEVTLHDIEILCELMHFIRAWWRAFEDTIRQLDRLAAKRAHDAVIDATILARRLARELGFAIPDFSGADWTPSTPGYGHIGSANDL